MPIGTKNIPSDKIKNIKVSLLGRFLRRTNFDELPQLINILQNKMSIVGPRPSTLEQKELINLRKKNGALKLKPGLTGYAQVFSFDGMSTKQKAKLDGVYAKKLSFKEDLKIVLRTFIYLMKKPPTY
jgi:O-antigen biosynthesis protein WbqP